MSKISKLWLSAIPNAGEAQGANYGGQESDMVHT
jgi:hypothetical protein